MKLLIVSLIISQIQAQSSDEGPLSNPRGQRLFGEDDEYQHVDVRSRADREYDKLHQEIADSFHNGDSSDKRVKSLID